MISNDAERAAWAVEWTDRQTGHFSIAGKRTFQLCSDARIKSTSVNAIDVPY